MELENILENATNGIHKDQLDIIDRFMPTINKFSKNLNYEGSKEDLIMFMLEILNSEKIKKLLFLGR